MIEQWIPVKGFKSIYECSTEGRIKSLPKYIYPNKNRGGFWTNSVILSETNINPDGYKVCTLYDENNKGITKSMHHFIFYSFNPDLSPKRGFEIDHLDNDKMNCKPTNLALITSRRNSIKRSLQKPKTSRFSGVYWCTAKGKWTSTIRIDGKKIFLGRYDDEELAAKAYTDKLKTL